MSILNEAILEELKQIVKEEVSEDVNQVKLEDAKIIVQVLLPEIDRIVAAKVNKFITRLAMEVISWELVKETEEKPTVTSSEPNVNPQEKKFPFEDVGF